MDTGGLDELRQRVAVEAYRFIEDEVRPFLAAGGRLWSKGSSGYPSQLRRMLSGLDRAHAVRFATPDAMKLDLAERVVEHVVPVKRIVIEIVDPSEADPRSNSSFRAIADGPATSPDHLIQIFDELLVKCWVTKEEHNLLNSTGRSFQWDAPGGDGWARYREAGVTAYPLAEDGGLVR